MVQTEGQPMRIASHLRRSKHGILSLRLTVPEDLRPLVGLRELKRSLKIRDSVIALHWALALNVRFGQNFEEFWLMVRRGYDPKNFDPRDSSTWPSEKGDVQGEYKAKFNIFTGEMEVETDPNHPEDHAQSQEALREMVTQGQALLENPVVAERLRLAKERDDSERAVLMAEVQKGMQVQAQAIAQQMAASATVLPRQSRVTPITLSEAASRYEQSLNGQNKKTVNDYMMCVNWFVGSLGDDVPVSLISDAMVADWRDEVITHYTRIRQKKQASKVAKGHLKPDPVAGLPEVDAKANSVDKIISRVHRFMSYCQRQRFFPRDEDLPTVGKTLLSHAERKKLSFYKAFIRDELRAIFAADKLLALQKPHEYWMPLLCLFTGARIGELSQMYLPDIYQESDNYWVIAIRDREGFQRLKTNAACRIIPIHPVLIELGFLDYIEDVKMAVPESSRVFPYLRYDEHNGFGDVPSESFARYLDSLGIHDDEKTAHSFRKTANQRLKDGGIDVPIRCQLVGHEKEGVNETVYATDISTANLLAVLREKLLFPEVDFNPLKYPKGRFVDVLKSEMLAAISRKRNKDKDKQAVAESDDSEGSGVVGKAPPSTPNAQGAKKVKSKKAPSERMQNHLAAKAAREARNNVQRGRPRKTNVSS